MNSLTQTLSGIVGDAFEAVDLPADLGDVRVSDRPDLAQFQCNGAMAAAKQAKKNPREIAQNIVGHLQQNSGIFEKIEIAGPGFLNLDITDQYLADFFKKNISTQFSIDKIGQNRTIILDYGGPNIAKPMHVGHLRASIIGDTLRRIAKTAGFNAIGDVHMGDWGTPMGMILSELEERGILGQPVTMQDLEKIYPEASQACKSDEARMEKARKATAKLQDGDETYRKAWQQFIDVSVDGMKKNFSSLNVHFDLWKGEADVHHLIAPMVDNLRERNYAHNNDGAVVVPVEKNDDTKEIPPLILYKRDGAVMYGTTDLATIVDRVQTYAPEKIVYVVDQRQALHFEQVFRAARLSGIAPDATELIHAGFGTMNGKDGKPFKTRDGGVMKLEDLIAMGVEKAEERLKDAKIADDIDAQECGQIAHMIAIAAIKFADLQNNRVADYVFDLDRMTSFEGKTGPYLLYQAVRIQSLLGKIDKEISTDICIDESTKQIFLLLTELPDVFDVTIRQYAPHHLCDYAYRLAQSFSSFYGNYPVLNEPNAQLRATRLAACAFVLSQLRMILDCLGIEIPSRM